MLREPAGAVGALGAGDADAPGEVGPAGPVMPPALALDERRIAALLDLLAQLDPRSRDVILSDCFARAENAQQLAELRQAVASLNGAKAPTKAKPRHK